MILCIIAVVENIVVCWLICRYRCLKTATNVFIFSLCITNILCSGILLPLHCFAEHSPLYPFLKLYIILSYICNLSAVTAERFISISRPLRYYHLVTKGRAIRITILCYFVPLIYCLLPLAWNANENTVAHRVYVSFTLLVFFIAPLIFILGVYARVYHATHKFFKKYHKQLVVGENKRGSQIWQEAKFMCCVHKTEIREERFQFVTGTNNSPTISLQTEAPLLVTKESNTSLDDVSIHLANENATKSFDHLANDNAAKSSDHLASNNTAKIFDHLASDNTVLSFVSEGTLETNKPELLSDSQNIKYPNGYISDASTTSGNNFPENRNRSVSETQEFMKRYTKDTPQKQRCLTVPNTPPVVSKTIPLPNGMSLREAAKLSKEFTYPRGTTHHRNSTLSSMLEQAKNRSETIFLTLSNKIIGRRRDSSLRSTTNSITSIFSSAKTKQMLSELKASIAFAMVALTYMFTWLPVVYMTSLGVLQINKSELLPDFLIVASVYTIGLNSMIDPLLYGLLLKDFRRAIKRTIIRKRTSKLDN